MNWKVLLRRWAKRGFLIYVRPFYDGQQILWIVQVEGGPKVLRAQSTSLSEAVAELEEQVPRRPSSKSEGWMAPKKKKSKRG